mgnify:CR=1 FL=1
MLTGGGLDFQVTVRVKHVEVELDAIEYFNKLNNVKAQSYEKDPNLLANAYIKALETQFNKNKKNLLIRPKKTARPYVSADTLREVLMDNVDLLKYNKEYIHKFVERVYKYNEEKVAAFELELTQEGVKDASLKERAILVKFALAYHVNLRWIRKLLMATK